MAERITAHDWSGRGLGPPADWPQSLKALAGVMLAASQPMFIIWGDERVWLYNDAFIPILGRKHPRALGRHALDEVWAEAAETLGPLFERVFAGGAVQMDDLALELDRRGRPEEAHFSFSYTPARDETGAVAGLFGVCTETTELFEERGRATRAQEAHVVAAAEGRTAAERVELALRAGAIVGTWVWDVPADRIVADEQFARSFGLDPALCQAGMPLDQAMASIHPDDAERVAGEIAAALARGGAYRCEYRVLHAEGGYRWTEASGEVEMSADGSPLRFAGVLVDTEERRRTEEALVQSNTLLRTFMEAVPGVIYAKDIDGRLLVGNLGTARLLGRPFEDFVGRTDMELLEDKAEAAALMANDRRIMTTGVAEAIEEKVTFPDGSAAWWLSSKAPLRDSAGQVVGLVGSSVDITERRRAEAHRLLLVNELNHRVKNTLAVVQGLARQTFRDTDNVRLAVERFEDRLTALSRTHNLLTDENWAFASLHDVVKDQLADCGGGRLVLEGPEVLLTPQVAVGLALVLHELCTNATKYGALSNETGRVRVSWALSPDGATARLRWQESGGPPVETPKRPGFGSRLIERALVGEIGGRVALRFPAEGVVCDIEAPVAAAA
jgi:PAS domain S-box-containing protein